MFSVFPTVLSWPRMCPSWPPCRPQVYTLSTLQNREVNLAAATPSAAGYFGALLLQTTDNSIYCDCEREDCNARHLAVMGAGASRWGGGGWWPSRWRLLSPQLSTAPPSCRNREWSTPSARDTQGPGSCTPGTQGSQACHVGSVWTMILLPLGTSCMVSEPWPSLPPLPWPQVRTWPPLVRKPEWNFCRTTLEMFTASLRKLSTMSGCSLTVAGQYSQTNSLKNATCWCCSPAPG